MNGINRVFLMGYLGSDPELKKSKAGKSFARLNLSTHHGKKLLTGEIQETTTWHRITVFGKTAERCHTFLQKGAALAVEGYLSKSEFEKESGEKVRSTDIIAQQVHFIGGKRDSLPGSGVDLEFDSHHQHEPISP
jgi:single-strand DNA-binding protein